MFTPSGFGRTKGLICASVQKKTLQEDRVVGGQHGVDEMTWKIEEVGDGYQVCCFPVSRFCAKRRNC